MSACSDWALNRTWTLFQKKAATTKSVRQVNFCRFFPKEWVVIFKRVIRRSFKTFGSKVIKVIWSYLLKKSLMENFIFCAGCHAIPTISSLMSFYHNKSERRIYISATEVIYSYFEVSC